MARSRRSLDVYPVAVLIGVGLIGASLMRDLKVLKRVRHVVGFGRDGRNLRAAKKCGAIDEIGVDLDTALARADLVVLATPVQTICEYLAPVARAVSAHALVIDVGSTKKRIADEAGRFFVNGHFVPCHPIAGLESSGARSSVRGLYQKRICVITPVAGSDTGALRRARQLWQAVGARVVVMDALRHDEILAATSHLPQVVASALMNVLGKSCALKSFKPFIGNGLRDTTRIAASDASLWTQIVLENRQRILPLLSTLSDQMASLMKAVEEEDGAQVFGFFKAASQFRKMIT